jgi:hypothetical protein
MFSLVSVCSIGLLYFLDVFYRLLWSLRLSISELLLRTSESLHESVSLFIDSSSISEFDINGSRTLYHAKRICDDQEVAEVRQEGIKGSLPVGLSEEIEFSMATI